MSEVPPEPSIPAQADPGRRSAAAQEADSVQTFGVTSPSAATPIADVVEATRRGTFKGGSVTRTVLEHASRQLEILALRSLELADRVAVGEIAFLDAVDLANEAAVWSGLTDTVGDDIVHATLAAAFANARRPT